VPSLIESWPYGSGPSLLHPELAIWLGFVHGNSPDELAEGEKKNKK
jgi:hypothetical protein